MSERIAALRQRLHESRERLNTIFDQIGDRGEEQIYSEGAQWTIRQLAIHLALADKGHNQMVYHYAEGKEFIPADYDIERYNKRSVEKSDEMTLEQARASLSQSRSEFLAWLDNLEDESVLDKTGRHATMKILPISDIIGIMAKHEDGHSADLEAMLKA